MAPSVAVLSREFIFHLSNPVAATEYVRESLLSFRKVHTQRYVSNPNDEGCLGSGEYSFANSPQISTNDPNNHKAKYSTQNQTSSFV